MTTVLYQTKFKKHSINKN